MNDSAAYSYDQIPYPSHAFPQTHPDRLATVATLFGMQPNPIDACRVLEIGCASGGNLVPMADALPNSRFVGFDLSLCQVQEGRQTIARLKLANIELLHRNILEAGRELGQFDYILCHGIYSWVGREVQDAIFSICQQLLAPQGVAYISYNTYPGWHLRGIVRDMMSYHSTRFPEPQQRVAQSRALLDFVARATAQRKEDPYALLLKAELELLRHQSDSYIYHEHLEDVNEPLYFHQFAERAARYQLQYLGESVVAEMWSGNLPADVAQALNRVAHDIVQKEQYIDFVRNRTFRQSLLCHAAIGPNRHLEPSRLRALRVASALHASTDNSRLLTAEPTRFERPGGGQSVTTSDPWLRCALICLAEQWPAAIAFDELTRMVQRRLSQSVSPDGLPNHLAEQEPGQVAHRLGTNLLECYVAGCLELQAGPCCFVTQVSERPRASAVARLQAASSARVTNRRHQTLTLNDLVRQLLVLLDGTRDRQALSESLTELVNKKALVVQKNGVPIESQEEAAHAIRTTLEQALARLARSALLVG